MSQRFFIYGLFGGLLFLLASTIWKNQGEFSLYNADKPEGFPEMSIPEGNELTPERVQLGRFLFYDPILSRDSSISCAHCHQQSLAFGSNDSISPGVDGLLAKRNAPTLTNVGYNPTFLFDGFLETLEKQVLVPIQEHEEFDFNIVLIAQEMKKRPEYVEMSRVAYGRSPDPFVITRSISAFERTLISGNSAFDQYYYQNKKDALTRSEKRGMKLFFEDLHCATCHSGFNFTNFQPENNGLYEHYLDSGRMRATKDSADRDLFKVPTLRNIALTAPYMHDGSIKTLEEVVDHYASGGATHPHKHPVIQPFRLSKRARKDLIHFLEALTDHDFITNLDLSNPFE